MRLRALRIVGTALAVLSLGLPWRTSYVRPGIEVVAYGPGLLSPARFFIVAAVALALVSGRLIRGRSSLRWAAYVGLAGLVLGGLTSATGGVAALTGAIACWWLAARDRVPDPPKVSPYAG